MTELRLPIGEHELRIRPSVLVLGLLFMGWAWTTGTPPAYLVGWLPLVIASILVHEGGHAWSAARHGLGPIAVEVHMVGGLTRYRAPRSPWTGLWITLAGPAAGTALGLLFLGAWYLGPQGSAWSYFTGWGAAINLGWSAFNLLPLWPLDGGQAIGSVFAGLGVQRPQRAMWATGVALCGVLVVVTVGTGELFPAAVALLYGTRNLDALVKESRRQRA